MLRTCTVTRYRDSTGQSRLCDYTSNTHYKLDVATQLPYVRATSGIYRTATLQTLNATLGIEPNSWPLDAYPSRCKLKNNKQNDK
jgi:hypothetical protein